MLASRVRMGSRKTPKLIPVTFNVLEGFTSVDVYTGNGVVKDWGPHISPDWDGENGGEYEFLARIGRNKKETFIIEEGTYVSVKSYIDYYRFPGFHHWYTNINANLIDLHPFYNPDIVSDGLMKITEPIEIFYNVWDDD